MGANAALCRSDGRTGFPSSLRSDSFGIAANGFYSDMAPLLYLYTPTFVHTDAELCGIQI